MKRDTKKTSIALAVLIALPAFAQPQNNISYDDHDLRINMDLGLGNKHWSYAELTALKPIINTDDSLFALDVHYMTHVGDENSNSNETSLGLVYRKPLNDGNSFIGLNTSYSLYETWDGNHRQTPHLGFEFVSNKFTFLANYMFQDDTIHANPTATRDYHPIYELDEGDYLHAGEAFTGGFEAVARYNISEKFALGLGFYDRFGDGTYEVTEIGHLIDPSGDINGGLPVHYEATSAVTNSYLLRKGLFIDGEITTDLGTLSLQLKYDDQHDFLGMLAFRIPFGGASTSDLKKSYVERKYYSPVYKADPDDFGLGLLIAAGAAAVSEAAAGAVAAASSVTLAQAAAAATVAGGVTTTVVNVKKLAEGK